MPAYNRSRAGYGNTHPLSEVDASADDIFHFPAANIHAAHPQSVRIWMRLDLLDHSHKHVIKTARQVLHILHLYCGHCQIIRQLFQVHILRNINIIFYPC